MGLLSVVKIVKEAMSKIIREKTTPNLIDAKLSINLTKDEGSLFFLFLFLVFETGFLRQTVLAILKIAL